MEQLGGKNSDSKRYADMIKNTTGLIKEIKKLEKYFLSLDFPGEFFIIENKKHPHILIRQSKSNDTLRKEMSRVFHILYWEKTVDTEAGDIVLWGESKDFNISIKIVNAASHCRLIRKTKEVTYYEMECGKEYADER